MNKYLVVTPCDETPNDGTMFDTLDGAKRWVEMRSNQKSGFWQFEPPYRYDLLAGGDCFGSVYSIVAQLNPLVRVLQSCIGEALPAPGGPNQVPQRRT